MNIHTSNRRLAVTIKSILYAFALLVTVALESSGLHYIRIFGVSPSVVIFIVATAAVIDGPVFGGCIGFFAGLLFDASLVRYGAFYEVFYLVAGVVIGYIAPLYFSRRIMTPVVCGAVAALIIETLRFIFFYYVTGHSTVDSVFTVVLPCGIVSLPFALAFIWPVMQIDRVGKKADTIRHKPMKRRRVKRRRFK